MAGRDATWRKWRERDSTWRRFDFWCEREEREAIEGRRGGEDDEIMVSGEIS